MQMFKHDGNHQIHHLLDSGCFQTLALYGFSDKVIGEIRSVLGEQRHCCGQGYMEGRFSSLVVDDFSGSAESLLQLLGCFAGLFKYFIDEFHIVHAYRNEESDDCSILLSQLGSLDLEAMESDIDDVNWLKCTEHGEIALDFKAKTIHYREATYCDVVL